MLSSSFRKAQYLSLDIVLGAVILLHFFSKQSKVYPDLYTYVLLAGSIWMIYTIDHLRDARKAVDGSRSRYQFHRRYRVPLQWTLLVVLVLCLGCLTQVHTHLIMAGSIVGLLSGVYLLIHPILSRFGAKELYVSLIYSTGILLAPFALSGTVNFTVFFELFLLSLANLILFSWFEMEEDRADAFTSIATVYDWNVTEKILLVILAMGTSFAWIMNEGLISVFFIIANSAYIVLFLNQTWARKGDRYRTIADGVFILPIFIEWV